MENHLCSECPEEYVTCKYSTLGCKKIVKMREMEDHLEDNSYHVTTCKTSEEITALIKFFKSPDHTVSDLSSLPLSFWPWLQNRPTCYPRPPWVVKLEGFDQALKNGGRWLSEPFYSHYGGYKMCLCVHQEEDGKGEGTQVSVSVHLMNRDNDDNLKFPFRATVTVSLLNKEMYPAALELVETLYKACGSSQSPNPEQPPLPSRPQSDSGSLGPEQLGPPFGPSLCGQGSCKIFTFSYLGEHLKVNIVMLMANFHTQFDILLILNCKYLLCMYTHTVYTKKRFREAT